MKVLKAAKGWPWRTTILAMILSGALAGGASAAVGDLTMDRTAALSPGRLHATLTGSITCSSGSTVYLNGQIVQAGNGSAYGSTMATCDGKSQEYTVDVSDGVVLKPGKASAQMAALECDPATWNCTRTYVDAIIRLLK
jgi:hypothetical protein